jgi:vacuolar-type H+-ATPase subunit I/STV1
MIAEMKKIALAIPNVDRELVLQFLQEETVMHIETFDSNTGVYSNETGSLLAQLQFSITFIEQLEKRLKIVRKKKLQDMFVGKPTADLKTLEKTLHERDAPHELLGLNKPIALS